MVTLFAIAFLPGMLGYFDGIPVAVGWLVMSGIAILTLEYVNYIRIGDSEDLRTRGLQRNTHGIQRLGGLGGVC